MSALVKPRSGKPGGYPMNHRIEALLFDLGGVLIEVVGAERMLQWCPHLADLETLWRRWLMSPGVRAYESGRSTRDEFARSVIAEFALPVEPDAFLDEFAWWPRRLHDDATTLLFIDDNAINVEAAQRLGIVARKAVGPAGVRAVLSELTLIA